MNEVTRILADIEFRTPGSRRVQSSPPRFC